MFNTFKYKIGYIHLSIIDGNELVKVQFDGEYSLIQVKSILAAKQLIGRQVNKNRG